jgi:hypothetical protein
LSGVSVGGAMPSRLLAGPAPDVSMAAVVGFALTGEDKRPMAAAAQAAR